MDDEGAKKKPIQNANAEKEKRLAEALRANLRRRKAAKKSGSIDRSSEINDSAGKDVDG